jgi:hypothetical protein
MTKKLPKESEANKVCFKISIKYVQSFGLPQVLWQAIPEAGGIITKGCLSMPLGPRLWDI